ncbi:TPA: DUF4258 domain-containing protein [Candidatus Micrarchaeota archaeon]|nr:DUF4258 domain-containing protein [Candidatus Micrarchaeota archaeon]
MRLQKGDWEFIFTLHAVFRAEERDIDGKTLEMVIQTGRFEKFGKNGMKIIKNTGERKIVLVGRCVRPGLIKILTVESG